MLGYREGHDVITHAPFFLLKRGMDEENCSLLNHSTMDIGMPNRNEYGKGGDRLDCHENIAVQHIKECKELGKQIPKIMEKEESGKDVELSENQIKKEIHLCAKNC
jgi:hypothetical protein